MYICKHIRVPPLTSVRHAHSLSSISPITRIHLKVPGQHSFFCTSLHHCSKLACACQSHKPPKGHSVIKWHAGPPRCLTAVCELSVVHPTALGGARCPETPPALSKEEEKTSSPLPPGGLCETSCCAVPASCHANALQLWRRRLPRRVAAGDIAGLQVRRFAWNSRILKCSTGIWRDCITGSKQHLSAEALLIRSVTVTRQISSVKLQVTRFLIF